MRKILHFIYDTWYGASSLLLGVYVVQACHNFMIVHFKFAMPKWTDDFVLVVAVVVLVCLLNCLIAVIVSFFRRKWWRAFGQIGLGVLTWLLSLVIAFVTTFYGMFGPSEDHFNDGLTIPADLKCEEPEPRDDSRPKQKFEDDAVFAEALKHPKDYRASLDALNEVCLPVMRKRRDLAIAYFEKNPMWEKVVPSRICAYKRVLWSGGQYCRIEMPTKRPIKYKILAKEGCDVAEAGWYAAGVELKREFERLAALKDESEIDSIMPNPKPYVSKEKPNFRLRNGFQKGIYEYKATVCPDEDGEVYLKAYEVTKNHPLSTIRMKERTLEKIVGPGEHVVGKVFTIYEGDWDRYYAARLEIWFKPSNGGAERKLKEKVFRVQGWMR